MKRTDYAIVHKLKELLKSEEPKVKWFIKNSKTGPDNQSMLHCAAKHYRYDPCRVLIDDIEYEPVKLTKSLKTPLHTMCMSETFKQDKELYDPKFEKCFNLLVSKGVDCNSVDDTNRTALHYAVMSKNIKAVESLCELRNIKTSVSFLCI